ncbi:MAG TPA: hypothetical protein VIK52_04610 [Opitutaceae bacterium]
MNSPFKNPELMVIGDSLPQGCRSLTVTKEFCAASYSAQATKLAGIKFTPPAHPRPILFNLEDIAHFLIFKGLQAYFGGVSSNYAKWINDFSAKQNTEVFFDNLAVTGATLEDVLGLQAQFNPTYPSFGTAELAEAYLQKFPNLELRRDLKIIGDLHTATNSRYVLNPGNVRARNRWSQLDWVRERQPHNLIVHVGHNNGLYAIGREGDIKDWRENWTQTAAPAPELYQRMIDRLASELPETRVLFIGLPKVGVVANLMPYGQARLAGDKNYFAFYETQFPFKTVVPGERIRQADIEIAAVNADLESRVARADNGAGRLQFFSAFDFFERLDYKNLGESPVRIGETSITNLYLDGIFTRKPGRASASGPRYHWEFENGGLQSIDGMHPTSIGYALLAFEIHEWLTGQRLGPAAIARHLKAVLRGESLVWQFPQGFDALRRLLEKFGHPNQSEDERTFNESMRSASFVTG